jgi:glutamate dehydrogenase
LPTDAEIAERYETGMPLTRPELAVLLSYAKLDLLGELLASRVPDDPVHEPLLTAYFPETLVAKFGDEVSDHRLRREIIATELTNAIINRGGSTMVVRLMEETGRSVADIVEAFVAAQAVFGLQDVWARIDDLDNKLSGNAQLDLYQKAQGILREKTAWFLRHRADNEALSTLIARHSDGLKSLSENLDDVLTPERAAEMESTKSALSDAGVPEALATELAVFVPLSDGPDIIAVASEADCSVAKAAQAFFEVGDYFRLAALQARARGLSVTDTFDRLAINSAMSMISDAQRLLSETVLGSGADGFERWLDAEGDGVVRARASMDEVAGATELTVSRLTVAAGQLRDLAQARQRASIAAE